MEKEDQLRREVPFSSFKAGIIDIWVLLCKRGLAYRLETLKHLYQAWLLTQPKACRDDELLSRAERLLHIRVQLQFKVRREIITRQL